jgi:hypothetical protein
VALVIHYQEGNINDNEMGAACSTHKRGESALIFFKCNPKIRDCLCGLVVRVPGYRSRGPGSISCGTRFSEK